MLCDEQSVWGERPWSFFFFGVFVTVACVLTKIALLQINYKNNTTDKREHDMWLVCATGGRTRLYRAPKAQTGPVTQSTDKAMMYPRGMVEDEIAELDWKID